MIELTGKINALNIDFVKGKTLLTLEINEKEAVKQGYDELHEAEKLSIEIKKYRKKRSLDANSYFWVLCGKLAAKTQQNKTDIYRHLIREIGDNYEILPIRNDAVETFINNWQGGRLGWVCDIVGTSKIAGYTNVCAYYGSSTYSSKQMSDLINSVIAECEEQGIQTETPEEINKMLSLWEQEKERG